VDAHFHMDATLSYGLPRVNQSGTLLEGIAVWGERMRSGNTYGVTDGNAVNGSGAGGIRLGGWQFA